MTTNNTECSFGGCETKVKARGLCSSHYGQWYAGKPLTPVRARRVVGSAKRTRRDVFLWCMYRMTEDEFVTLSANGCSLCGESEDLVVDHDHSCCAGKKSCGVCVRGVLCRTHNVWLGMVEDSAEFLETALAYLRVGLR